MKDYLRKPLFNRLWGALHGEPNFIQAVTGPRQVGKTTLARQILEKWKGPKIYQTADEPGTPSYEWISEHWQKARSLSRSKGPETLLVLDEAQKIPHWSEAIKKLFDEDKNLKRRLRVVILGSSALLMQRGLTESLAGRFEIHRHNHWSFSECKEYFSLSLEEYLYFGGYPGALLLRKNQSRWARYIRDSIIETVLSKDVILMMPVTKPALLRQVFSLAAAHPAQVISYQKMLGQLQDVGNTTTVASYIKLLSNAFLATALERWSGSTIKQRASIPKLIVMDNALISAMSGRKFREVERDKVFWGRMLENAVGAKLYAILQEKGADLFYWRQRQEEIDYVIKIGDRLIAIEVKSGIPRRAAPCLAVFTRRYKKAKPIIISPTEDLRGKEKAMKSITIEEFFSRPHKCIGL